MHFPYAFYYYYPSKSAREIEQDRRNGLAKLRGVEPKFLPPPPMLSRKSQPQKWGPRAREQRDRRQS